MSGTVDVETSELGRLIAGLPPDQIDAFLAGLTPDQLHALRYDWRLWARPKQLPPKGDWHVWFLLGGRGSGKTRTGSMWVHSRAMEGNASRRMALVSKTPGDARDDMIEGMGGILRNVPPDEKPDYNPSKRRLTWPTGAWATIYSGAHPEQIRGFSGDTLWADELAAWEYPTETWQQLTFGLREGACGSPQILVTTTPKPIGLIREIKNRCVAQPDRWVMVISSSFENRANLHPDFYTELLSQYEGTAVGRQEIYADILDEMPGALWRRHWLDRDRLPPTAELPDFIKITVGIDPAVTATEESNETGIMVGALGRNNYGYLLADLSCRETPQKWAARAVKAYHEYDADDIIAEANQGGDLVRATIHSVSPDVPVRLIHASRAKRTRAEPIAAKSELGRIHHVGSYPKLEDQLCTWVPGDDSPDRLDAYVHCFTHLMLSRAARARGAKLVSMTQDNPFLVK